MKTQAKHAGNVPHDDACVGYRAGTHQTCVSNSARMEPIEEGIHILESKSPNHGSANTSSAGSVAIKAYWGSFSIVKGVKWSELKRQSGHSFSGLDYLNSQKSKPEPQVLERYVTSLDTDVYILGEENASLFSLNLGGV